MSKSEKAKSGELTALVMLKTAFPEYVFSYYGYGDAGKSPDILIYKDSSDTVSEGVEVTIIPSLDLSDVAQYARTEDVEHLLRALREGIEGSVRSGLRARLGLGQTLPTEVEGAYMRELYASKNPFLWSALDEWGQAQKAVDAICNKVGLWQQGHYRQCVRKSVAVVFTESRNDLEKPLIYTGYPNVMKLTARLYNLMSQQCPEAWKHDGAGLLSRVYVIAPEKYISGDINTSIYYLYSLNRNGLCTKLSTMFKETLEQKRLDEWEVYKA